MSALAEALVAAQAELPCVLGKDADGQIGTRAYRYLAEPDPAEQAARERYAAMGEAWDAEPVRLVTRG